MYDLLEEFKAKNMWIQNAKALLFDCMFSVDSPGLKEEIERLIEKGGGYDPLACESPSTCLRWPND